MEKKRSRVISGWRQVARAKPGFAKSPRRVVAQPEVAPTLVAVPVPVAEKPAAERWETEGGHLAAKK
jgi:hypothetical protein